MSVSSLAPLQAAAQAPLRAVRLGTFEIAAERRPDGALLVRPTNALGPYPNTITAWLDHWTQNAPDRAFLVERGNVEGGKALVEEAKVIFNRLGMKAFGASATRIITELE